MLASNITLVTPEGVWGPGLSNLGLHYRRDILFHFQAISGRARRVHHFTQQCSKLKTGQMNVHLRTSAVAAIRKIFNTSSANRAICFGITESQSIYNKGTLPNRVGILLVYFQIWSAPSQDLV